MGFITKIFSPSKPKSVALPPVEAPDVDETARPSATRRRAGAGFRGTIATSTMGAPATAQTLRPTLG